MKTIIDGITITNPNKIVYKAGNITKLDVVKYYSAIAPLMIKQIRGRLISVIRCHNGANESCFFKKHPSFDKNMVKVFNVNGEEYFYLTSAKQIVYQAQMGTVEFHIWGSKVNDIDHPNIMVFDLDPDENLSFKTLISGVKILKDCLNNLKLKSFLKTSGGKGYHITVPIKTVYSWDELAQLSKNIAEYLQFNYPSLFTTSIKKANRKNKIFIDYLRNKKTATCVAPYSLRAREGAPISMPISWNKLNKIKPNEININNYKKYLK